MEEKGEIGIASIHAALATGGRRGARTNQQTALSWRHVFLNKKIELVSINSVDCRNQNVKME